MLSASAAVASGKVIHGFFFKDIFIFTHSSHPLLMKIILFMTRRTSYNLRRNGYLSISVLHKHGITVILRLSETSVHLPFKLNKAFDETDECETGCGWRLNHSRTILLSIHKD